MAARAPNGSSRPHCPQSSTTTLSNASSTSSSSTLIVPYGISSVHCSSQSRLQDGRRALEPRGLDHDVRPDARSPRSSRARGSGFPRAASSAPPNARRDSSRLLVTLISAKSNRRSSIVTFANAVPLEPEVSENGRAGLAELPAAEGGERSGAALGDLGRVDDRDRDTGPGVVEGHKGELGRQAAECGSRQSRRRP